MTLEQILIGWFRAHPFVHMLVVAAIAGISNRIHSDWTALQAYKATDPAARWSLTVAARQYGLGVVLAVAPILGGDVLKILNASAVAILSLWR